MKQAKPRLPCLPCLMVTKMRTEQTDAKHPTKGHMNNFGAGPSPTANARPAPGDSAHVLQEEQSRNHTAEVDAGRKPFRRTCFFHFSFKWFHKRTSISYLTIKANQLQPHSNRPWCSNLEQKVFQYLLLFSLTENPSWYLWNLRKFRRPQCKYFLAEQAPGSGETDSWPDRGSVRCSPAGRSGRASPHPLNERDSQVPSDSEIPKLQTKLTQNRRHKFSK